MYLYAGGIRVARAAANRAGVSEGLNSVRHLAALPVRHGGRSAATQSCWKGGCIRRRCESFYIPILISMTQLLYVKLKFNLKNHLIVLHSGFQNAPGRTLQQWTSHCCNDGVRRLSLLLCLVYIFYIQLHPLILLIHFADTSLLFGNAINLIMYMFYILSSSL